MRFPQRHLGREDNVEFDKVIGAGVVHTASVDLEDLGGEGHCLDKSFSGMLCCVDRILWVRSGINGGDSRMGMEEEASTARDFLRTM